MRSGMRGNPITGLSRLHPHPPLLPPRSCRLSAWPLDSVVSARLWLPGSLCGTEAKEQRKGHAGICGPAVFHLPRELRASIRNCWPGAGPKRLGRPIADALDTKLSSQLRHRRRVANLGVLELLALGRHEDRMQGLRIFCEHRDPRPFQGCPLLEASCSMLRVMSRRLSLGRNPIERLWSPCSACCRTTANGYVRKGPWLEHWATTPRPRCACR